MFNTRHTLKILSYLLVTSDGEPLDTWLAVQTFSQVVSMSALQAQGHRVNPTVARNTTIQCRYASMFN